jgi:hypothetical protein
MTTTTTTANMEYNVDSHTDDKAVILYPPVRCGCHEHSRVVAVVLEALTREKLTAGMNLLYRVAGSMKSERSNCFWNTSWRTCTKAIVKPRSMKREPSCKSTSWIALPRLAGSCTCLLATIPWTDISRSPRKTTPLGDWLKSCAIRKSNGSTTSSVSTTIPIPKVLVLSPVGGRPVHRKARNKASKRLRLPCCP